MSRKAKKASKTDGRKFLQDSFAAAQEVLRVQLELSRSSITHDGTMGSVNESHFVDTLRHYLPNRYSVNTGIVIDSEGRTSDQIDVIVYDRQYIPTLLDQQGHRYVPAEAVYAVFECKPSIDKGRLEYAADKAASVRALKRTSIEIVNAGKVVPARPLFPIVAGIVAGEIAWKDGFAGRAFQTLLRKLTGDKTVDCGLAVSGDCFDLFDDGSKVTLGPKKQSLVFFLFRFLQKIQSLGTVPAIEWDAYARQLSKR